MSNLRFKVGDRAKVVTNTYGHNFKIDAEVEIVDVLENAEIPYRCVNSDTLFSYWLSDSELAPTSLRFKVGDRVKVVERGLHSYLNEVEISNVNPDDVLTYQCTNGRFYMDSELAPIESLEEKTAKAFEEIANGTGPEMVVISAEEYANFQEMEKLLGRMFIHMNGSLSFYNESLLFYPEIEKLLKQKYNP